MNRYALLLLSLSVSTPALANYVDGTITLRPLATIDGTGANQTITLSPPVGAYAYQPAFQTGDFLPYDVTSGFGFAHMGEAQAWQTWGLNPSNLFCNCDVTGTNGIIGWSFDVTRQTANTHTDTHFEILGIGTLTMSGFAPTLTQFWLNWDLGTTDLHFPPPPQSVEFSLNALNIAPPSPVPGPIVGAGLPGIIVALLGMLSLNRHRCRRRS
jgi:hypothetical protein